MQSFIVLASLVFELAGGQNDPLCPSHYRKHLSPIRVKIRLPSQSRRSAEVSWIEGVMF